MTAAGMHIGAKAGQDELVVMLLAYFDDAGTDPSSPIVTMAGHVARRRHWEQFEKKSKKMFAREGVTEPFHAIDFERRVGSFAGWSRNRRIQFLADWTAIAAKKWVTGVTVSVPRALYREAQNSLKVHQNVSPLHEAFISALVRMVEDDEVGPLIEKLNISFFLEDSDKLSGLAKWYDHKKKQPETGGHLRALSFIDKNECRAIQYADALAFYSRRHAISYEKHGEDIVQPEFRALLRFNHIGGVIGSFTRSDVPKWKLKPTWTAS